MAIRIYAVQGPGFFKLVEATSKRKALTYAIKDLVHAEIASQRVLVAAMVEGVKIEGPELMNGVDNEALRSNESKFKDGQPVILDGDKIGKRKNYSPPYLKPFV